MVHQRAYTVQYLGLPQFIAVLTWDDKIYPSITDLLNELYGTASRRANITDEELWTLSAAGTPVTLATGLI